MDAQDRENFVNKILIREQIDNYIDALNHRDWDRLAETLCEDFEWSVDEPWNQNFKSKKDFVHMLKTVQSYQYGFVFQMGHAVVVRKIEGNSAKVCHTLVIFGNSFEAIGLYYDNMRKEADGVWRFVSRDFKPTYHDTRNVPGKIYRQLPDPGYQDLPRS